MSSSNSGLTKSNEIKRGKKIFDLFGYRLTPFERHEILKYENVFYFGENRSKKFMKYRKKQKSKYHTKKGLYDCVIGDHLNYKYEVLGTLGEGGYSLIYEAYDHQFKRNVAIKNLINFATPDAEKLREIEILAHVKRCDATDFAVEMFDYFLFRGFVFITFEQLHTDLDALLGRRRYGFGQDFVSNIAYSLFSGLEALHHTCKIVHCDIKPENLLLVEKGSAKIKIADFGLSCNKFDMDDHKFKQTRFYQAPEVLMKGPVGSPIDIWSAGCVLAELLTGQPLFCGDDDYDQVSLIMGLLGIPPEDFLSECDPDTILKYIREDGFPRYCTVESDGSGCTKITPNKSPEGHERVLPGGKKWEDAFGPFPEAQLLDFLRQCLTWNPDDRITAGKALRHEYLTRRHASTYVMSVNCPHHSGPTYLKPRRVYSGFHRLTEKNNYRPSSAAF